MEKEKIANAITKIDEAIELLEDRFISLGIFGMMNDMEIDDAVDLLREAKMELESSS